jgi:hypothetical protein
MQQGYAKNEPDRGRLRSGWLDLMVNNCKDRYGKVHVFIQAVSGGSA